LCAQNAGASHVVVDLTQGSPEDDVLVTRAEPASKRARLLPLPFSAPQPPPPLSKPDAKCAICLEPMVQMACGPCGCAPLPSGLPGVREGARAGLLAGERWRVLTGAAARRHVFCDACLKASVKASRRCPTCRKALQPRQIHRIYLD